MPLHHLLHVHVGDAVDIGATQLQCDGTPPIVPMGGWSIPSAQGPLDLNISFGHHVSDNLDGLVSQYTVGHYRGSNAAPAQIFIWMGSYGAESFLSQLRAALMALAGCLA